MSVAALRRRFAAAVERSRRLAAARVLNFAVEQAEARAMRVVRQKIGDPSANVPTAPRWRGMLRDRRAGVAIITAVTFPLMLGFVGLASEAGLWMLQRRVMQGVADAAAYSAAVAIANGSTTAFVTSDCSAPTGAAVEACGVAAANGFTSGVWVASPPTQGPYNTAARYGPTGYSPVVEVIITRTPQTLIAAFFGSTSITLRARAAAAINASSSTRVPQQSDCVLALDPTASGAVDAHGSTVSTLNNCGLAVNSNSTTSVTTEGGGTVDVSGASVTLVGSQSSSGLSATGGIASNQKPVADPYASLPAPSTSGCSPGTSISSAGLYSPGCYSDITMHPNGDVVVLQAGTYVITGSIDLTHDTLEDCSVSPKPPLCPAGDSGGVTIILTNSNAGSIGSFTENGGFNLQISAPTTGTYAGVAIYQDRRAAVGNTVQINGGSTTGVVNGAVYFPSAAVTYIGNEGSTNSGCTVLIADTISFGGTAGTTFGGSTCSSGGGAFGNGMKVFGIPGLVE